MLHSEPFTNIDCCQTTQWSFSAREVADGTFFRAIGDHDVDSKQAHYQLEKYVSLTYSFFLLFLLNGKIHVGIGIKIK